MSSSGASRSGGAIPTQGTAAARPANPTPGQMYWATDTNEISVGNLAGNAWQQIGRITPTLGSDAVAAFAGGNLVLTGGGTLILQSVGGPINAQQSLDVTTLGAGIRVAEGANAKQGTYGPLAAGTLAVANTSVTASSRILVCRSAGGANPGAHYVSAQTTGTGFTVTSTSATDTGSGVFFILEPG